MRLNYLSNFFSKWNQTRLFGFIWWSLIGFLGFISFLRWVHTPNIFAPHFLGVFLFLMGYPLFCYFTTENVSLKLVLSLQASFILATAAVYFKHKNNLFPIFIILPYICFHWIVWFTKLIKNVSIEQFQFHLLSKRNKWFKACQKLNYQTVKIPFSDEFFF